MRLFFFFLLVFVAVANPGESFAQGDFTVKSRRLQDEKAVFATVESVHVIAARTRIAGTLADVAVTEGDAVRQDQTLAKVGDEKLALQIGGMDSRIHSLKAQFDKAQTDLDRAKSLFASGTVAKARLDEAQTQYNIAQSALVAGQADRDVIRRQVGEGDVLAPVSGRVLSVLVTQGAVVMPGEPVALIAEENYVLRLQVPERHARYLKKGDSIRLDDGKTGKIVTVYPKIENGRVVADAVVEGLGDYFVGERVRVRISGGERRAFVVPASYVVTRFGIDHVRLKGADGAVMEAPVQMGVAVPLEDVPDGVEILSGLRDGDVLVTP